MTGFDSIKICALALITAICYSVVRRVNPSFDAPMRLASSVVLLGVVIGAARPLFSYLSGLVAGSELDRWQGMLFSAMGIAFLSHVSAELCRDCGEGSIGGYCELIGKVEILLLCLPLINELLSEVERLVP